MDMRQSKCIKFSNSEIEHLISGDLYLQSQIVKVLILQLRLHLLWAAVCIHLITQQIHWRYQALITVMLETTQLQLLQVMDIVKQHLGLQYSIWKYLMILDE